MAFSNFALHLDATTHPVAYPEQWLWSGNGTLSWQPPGDTQSRDWEGGRLLAHSDYESSAFQTETKLTVTIRLPNSTAAEDVAERTKWLQDRGAFGAQFYKLFSTSGATYGYRSVDYVEGRVSAATLDGDALSVTIERMLENPSRKAAEYMDMVYLGRQTAREAPWPP